VATSRTCVQRQPQAWAFEGPDYDTRHICHSKGGSALFTQSMCREYCCCCVDLQLPLFTNLQQPSKITMNSLNHSRPENPACNCRPYIPMHLCQDVYRPHHPCIVRAHSCPNKVHCQPRPHDGPQEAEGALYCAVAHGG
jgi:hypothetical protein